MSAPSRPTDLVVLHAGDMPPGIAAVADEPRLTSIRYATAEQLPEALPGANALFVWDLFSEALAGAWGKADSLEWVHAATAGVNHLMFPASVHSDVTITNSRGVFDEPIAEYVLGLVLAFAKDLGTTLDLQHRREWHHRETERVGNRTALVAGTGPIGRAIARQLTAIGMQVTGVGRVAKADDPDFGRVVASTDLHEVLPDADYIVLAAPLTDATRGMIDAAALQHMRPSARVINVGRGDLVVQDDLVAALQHETIAGAALDVFAEEPLPKDSPLWHLPNSIVSPHMSGDVVGWREELVRLFQDNLDRFLDGRELRNVVDKQRGYVSGT